MNKFKSLVTLTLLSSSVAFAGPGQVGSATEPNQQSEVCAAYNIGVASEVDVLLVEKGQLEIRLAKDSGDYAAYKALTQNTLKRFQHAKARFEKGFASVDDVTLVQAEVIGLNVSCPVLLNTAQKLFKVGLKSTEQVQTIQSACEMLAAK